MPRLVLQREMPDGREKIVVSLSGVDQIALILRTMHGGFTKYIHELEENYYRDNSEDIAIQKRIRAFEKRHEIIIMRKGRGKQFRMQGRHYRT